MSTVVFPFKVEDPEVAAANLAVAARHPRVSQVMAVGASQEATFTTLSEVARALTADTHTPVEVILQDRIGVMRPGKGDGMNTALRRFLDTDGERIHFYDADITNFDASWIDGAEQVADRGYPVVRHHFPRASTDAMITWMVTRPLFALAHPDSVLWQIRQPLGGELLLTREVAAALVADPLVEARSDWGIDTVISYATVAFGQPIYEHYIADGKQHALYGSLADIRDMVVECFEAAASVAGRPSPGRPRHDSDPSRPAPPGIAHRVGFDVERTLHLLGAPWPSEAISAASHFPEDLSEPLLANMIRPTFAFLDADAWRRALLSLLDSYRSEPGWREVLFRLWVARVIAYTTTDALAGHTRAMEILEESVRSYAETARPSGHGQ